MVCGDVLGNMVLIVGMALFIVNVYVVDWTILRYGGIMTSFNLIHSSSWEGDTVKNRKLTFIEATMLVAGAGIGTGILTIPYAVEQIGIFGTLTALAAAYGVSVLLYLIIADLTLNSKESAGLLGILQEHLLFGKNQSVLKTVFFVILTVLLLENLVVYIMCAADVLAAWFGIDTNLAKVIFYLLASLVIIFGIKGVGIGEKFSVTLIGSVIAILTVLSLIAPKNSFSITFGEPHLVFAVYGLFMFAFSAIFSIIQVCNHIERVEDTKKAVVGGLSINACLTLIFAAAAILGSDQVTEIATIGLAATIGIPFVRIICSVFVLLAMFSSYWSSGLAFADMVEEQFNLGKRWSWFLSTVPTILIAILLPLTVLDYVQIGAGALSVILVIVVLPAYYHAAKHSQKKLLLGKVGRSKALLYAVGLMVVLMAVSSFISID